MTDTIVAIATAGGIGSIAIVRLSGSASVTLARRVAPGASFRPRQADLTSLYDQGGTLIDQGIVLYFQSPRSFTGEEIVEFQCHGGQIIAQEILTTLMKHGARLAEPGEFSKRAFLNGKIDLSKAEAIAKMIATQSADAARILARQLKGELGVFVEEIRSELLHALSHSEVMIDYAEEIPDDLPDKLIPQLQALSNRMRRIVESSHRRQGILEGFRVAIIGKPNVGKSSLLNALLDNNRAIVSDIAGTTRDTIEEPVRIGSHLILLIDTAGIRHASDTIEQIGVERSLRSIAEADVIIALFDGSRPFDREDARILELLEHSQDTEQIIALNKSDLPRAIEDKYFTAFSPIEISAVHHFDHLIEVLKKRLDARGEGEEILLISARQIDAVEKTKHAIEEAFLPLRQGELELFSYHLQEAVKQIASITIPYDNDEILDHMFGEFCLGK
jgi:tRNA modification GTPase